MVDTDVHVMLSEAEGTPIVIMESGIAKRALVSSTELPGVREVS